MCHPEGRSGAEDGAAVDTPGLRRLSGRFFWVGVAVPVDVEVRVQLKVLAAERRTTVHQFVCRALNGVFADERQAGDRALTAAALFEATGFACGAATVADSPS